MHAYIHTYTHTYIHTHTHTYIHTSNWHVMLLRLTEICDSCAHQAHF
jgi:hypothetical protein